ncbi:hypothetical protein PMAC_000468 [Pneumocystis sp. 'macacae']|nr:hypothetical protein PMAC_000468 [Pneumocystis sp. 'macacae']
MNKNKVGSRRGFIYEVASEVGVCKVEDGVGWGRLDVKKMCTVQIRWREGVQVSVRGADKGRVFGVLIRGGGGESRGGENEVSRRGSTGGSEVSVCAKQQGMSEVGWGREEVREVCGRDRVGRRGAPSMMRVRGAERSGGAK